MENSTSSSSGGNNTATGKKRSSITGHNNGQSISISSSTPPFHPSSTSSSSSSPIIVTTTEQLLSTIDSNIPNIFISSTSSSSNSLINNNNNSNTTNTPTLVKSQSMEELNRLLDQLSTETIVKKISDGNQLVNIGKHQEAVDLFTSIIQSNPLVPSAYLGRGTAQAIAGELDGAIKDFTRVIELDNTMSDAYKRRGQSLAAKGLHSAALEDFDQALTHLRDSRDIVDLFYNRALTYYQLRNYKRAVKDFKVVVEIEPQHILAWNRIGLCLNVLGDPRGSFIAFENTLALDETFEAGYTNIGQCWKDLGDYEQSLEAFTRALEIVPEYSNALHLRGLLFFNSGRLVQATQDWSTYLRNEPLSIDIRQLRAVTYHSLGRFKESLSDYDQITQLNPLHYSFYQREIALFTHHHLDLPIQSFNIDNLLNVYIKTFLCQRMPPTSLIGYQSPYQYNPASIADVSSAHRLTEDQVSILRTAKHLGQKLQYDCEGFLPNSRQQLQCGLAVLEMSQVLKNVWKSLNNNNENNQNNTYIVDGRSSSWTNDNHHFQWRDLYDIAVKWRQYSEPNDPVWWVDRLSPEQFKEGFGSHTPLITGQTKVVRYYPMFARAFKIMKSLLPMQLGEVLKSKDNININNNNSNILKSSGGASSTTTSSSSSTTTIENTPTTGILKECLEAKNCKELYNIIKKDFYVITPCFGTHREKETVMEGTRLTLQYISPEGYEFAIRTPCTPERCSEYNQQMELVWNHLCELIKEYLKQTSPTTPPTDKDQTQILSDASLLDKISDQILTLTFYWYNYMPLTRGSAAVGYTVLLGLFLSLDIEISSKIFKGQQPDWEGILSPNPSTFISVLKKWMYPSRSNVDMSNIPIVSQNISTIRQMIQILNFSCSTF